MGGGFELGSGLNISKLAWELVMGLRALREPILKLERPTPFAFEAEVSVRPVGRLARSFSRRQGGQGNQHASQEHLVGVPAK